MRLDTYIYSVPCGRYIWPFGQHLDCQIERFVTEIENRGGRKNGEDCICCNLPNTKPENPLQLSS